jgi:hypothetical protein
MMILMLALTMTLMSYLPRRNQECVMIMPLTLHPLQRNQEWVTKTLLMLQQRVGMMWIRTPNLRRIKE